MFIRCEYDQESMPIKRDGMTSMEAITLLRAALPDVPDWLCWIPRLVGVDGMVRKPGQSEGTVGAWRWRRLACPYPAVIYYEGGESPDCTTWRWTGLVEVTAPGGGTFMLFSYLDSAGAVGSRFLVSTASCELLNRFGADMAAEADRTGDIRICRVNAEDIVLTSSPTEWIVLPARMQADIETQVFTFFESRAAYERLGVPYRRGLLFAGPPGCGKTLMVRRMVRECHKRFDARAYSILPSAHTDADDLGRLFRMAARHAPSLVILDDMDSLTKETQIARAALLGELDGLRPHDGVLVIGTTNNPGDIDPAMAHRPSRFDRVWRFGLPGSELRTEYFRHTLDGIGPEVLQHVVQRTRDWSFAYLQELRASAGILAIREGSGVVGESHLRDALEILGTQFGLAQKGHVSGSTGAVGFAGTGEERSPGCGTREAGS